MIRVSPVPFSPNLLQAEFAPHLNIATLPPRLATGESTGILFTPKRFRGSALSRHVRHGGFQVNFGAQYSVVSHFPSSQLVHLTHPDIFGGGIASGGIRSRIAAIN